MRRGRLLRTLVIPVLVAGITSAPATAQTPAGAPTVDIRPLGASANDPGAGTWFYSLASPGQTVTFTAELSNSATVAQTVRGYLADLVFDENDSPNVGQEPYREIGAWGAFDTPTVTVPPRERVRTVFRVTPPEGIAPGDYVGIALIEHVAEGQGQFDIVKRVGTKVYVTIPGDAPREFSIRAISVTKDSALFPREATVRVSLRNDGRIRLQPTVTVNDEVAKGSGLLLTKSAETYLATVKIPVWGGPMRFRVDVVTEAAGFPGPSRQQYASAFFVPWHLAFAFAALIGAALVVRWLWRRRGTKYSSLRADLLRIERLLAHVGDAAGIDAKPEDPRMAIQAAIKQARRAGDVESAKRLERKLAESGAAGSEVANSEAAAGTGTRPGARPPTEREATGRASLAAILEELRTAPPEARGDLIQAARAFGLGALREHANAVDALPREVRLQLLFRAVRGAGAPTRGPRRRGNTRRDPRA